MGALLPVFGLVVLTIEWTILRQLAPRLVGRSVARRAVLGAAAGFGTWAIVTLLCLLVAVLIHLLGVPDDVQVLATATFYLLLFGGILIVPVAAGFGAALLAVERYRVPSGE